MKLFKCGKCAKNYKVDTSKVESTKLVITCSSCNSKNIIRLGPVLVTQSKEGTRQFSLNLGENTIGRKTNSSPNKIQIDDQYVSRNHASIFLEEKENKLYFFIADLESKNGTFNKSKSKIKSQIKYPLTPNDYYIVGLTKVFIKYN
jgi:pSer/pThr/pTyr-binding forkhead associated (FHA) protein